MNVRCLPFLLYFLVQPAFAWERLALHSSSIVGLSGLDIDSEGVFWGVSERQTLIFKIRLQDKALILDGKPLQVSGTGPELDLEAFAWIGEGQMALGTESQETDREQDWIYLAQLEGDEIKATEKIAFSYKQMDLQAGKNHGIEGLCHAGGYLLAASEAVGQTGGRRYAPFGRYDIAKKDWAYFKLALTSDRGRISSLACKATPEGGLDVLAIERQFGVMRLLRFSMPQSGPGSSLQPKIALDITTLTKEPPNFEGIAWMEDGRALLLSDNDYRGAAGPTEGFLGTP